MESGALLGGAWVAVSGAIGFYGVLKGGGGGGGGGAGSDKWGYRWANCTYKPYYWGYKSPKMAYKYSYL